VLAVVLATFGAGPGVAVLAIGGGLLYATFIVLFGRKIFAPLGRMVERNTTASLFKQPRHPYTRGLIDAAPAGHVPGQPLPQIPGNVPLPPPLSQAGRGCAFAPRCGYASARCGETEPAPPEQAVSATHRATHRVRCHHPLVYSADGATEAITP
jgi:peptide/nickel transport system ATP-binding protein